jgi:hypothetical protein
MSAPFFEKSYACGFPSMMECCPALIGERQKVGVERRESHGVIAECDSDVFMGAPFPERCDQ